MTKPAPNVMVAMAPKTSGTTSAIASTPAQNHAAPTCERLGLNLRPGSAFNSHGRFAGDLGAREQPPKFGAEEFCLHDQHYAEHHP